ncbi:MAG: DUF3795 domain-containing protein [Clostridia bacterium]|nr:DUF3795 domain-containing protein [Clostridia bacterium]
MNGNGLAPCGLDCGSCNLYKAAHDLEAAAALVDWFRSRGWIGEEEGAASVQQKAPFCMGCQDKQEPCWCGECFLRDCCEEKKYAHCGQCPDFPCAKYMEWTVGMPHHQAAMEILMMRSDNAGRF